MITIRIPGDDGKRALAGISSRMSHPAPVMRVIAGLLEDRVAENSPQIRPARSVACDKAAKEQGPDEPEDPAGYGAPEVEHH